MAEKKKAVVVIPFYKNTLNDFERIALLQCFKVLGDHEIVAIKPFGLNLPGDVKIYSFSQVVEFDDDYFKSVQGYNRLMLDSIFYKAFLAYEYMLIYQLDAFVFKDELLYWCSQGIDYVGAPWMRAKDYPNFIKAEVSKVLQYFARRYNVKKRGLPSKKQFDDSVGNGGFSLRRVERFYNICIDYKDKIAEYNSMPTHHYNEDVFWGLELNRKRKVLNIPGYKQALRFAIELAPERSLKINNDVLPFGCHAWDLDLNFWRPIFKQYGYVI
jgi:hypothetical protein